VQHPGQRQRLLDRADLHGGDLHDRPRRGRLRAYGRLRLRVHAPGGEQAQKQRE
jgi:hypothetical protein